MINPFNCKEVTTRLALGDMSQYSWRERLMIRLHLAICWVCRKYERQMKVIGRAFSSSIENLRRESDTGPFKERLIKRLRHRQE